MAFRARTSAPSKGDKWFYGSNPFHAAGYGLPNCTAYAWGRFAEILGKAPKLSLSNAENWYGHTSDGYKRGKAPKLGAVIVWSKGKVGNGSDGAGHVAIVEKIYSDGSFLVSESGWKASSIMWTKTIPKSCARSGYTFLGFIYNPAVKDDSTVSKKSTKSASLKVGGTYTLQTNLNVRTGAGTKFARKKVRDLTADGKKHATSTRASDIAVLKKDTEVTVQQINGNWIKCPSGWLCWKENGVQYIK